MKKWKYILHLLDHTAK